MFVDCAQLFFLRGGTVVRGTHTTTDTTTHTQRPVLSPVCAPSPCCCCCCCLFAASLLLGAQDYEARRRCLLRELVQLRKAGAENVQFSDRLAAKDAVCTHAPLLLVVVMLLEEEHAHAA